MTVRNIVKQLITMEDFAQGSGTVNQVRGPDDANYTLGLVDTPYSVSSVVAMQDLAVAAFTRARVYSDTTTYVDYIYDPARVDGILSNTGTGSWIAKANVGPDTWLATTVYGIGNLTVGSDGEVYKAKVVHANRDPVTDDGASWCRANSMTKVANYATFRNTFNASTLSRHDLVLFDFPEASAMVVKHVDVDGAAADDGGYTLVSTLDTNVYLDRSNATTITVGMFQATGDSITDDMANLQLALDWSSTNNLPIFFEDKLYYTSGQLLAKDSIIRSISGNPGVASPTAIVSGGIGSAYFYHTTQAGIDFTWAQFVAEANTKGCAIISDFDGAILSSNGDSKFNVEGIGIIGDHRQQNQVGLGQDTGSYEGNIEHVKNVRVTGTGSHGIHFARGLEITNLHRIVCTRCNGHGILIDKVPAVTSPVEFLNITECELTSNRLANLKFAHVKKAVSVQYSNLSHAGQVDDASGVDPLLSYDRTVPATTADMVAGCEVEDGSLDGAGGPNLGFVFNGNFGEQTAVGLHFRSRISSGVARNITLTNNTFFRSANVPNGGGENGALFFLDVTYIGNLLQFNNEHQSLQKWVYASVPSRDAANGVLMIDDAVKVATVAEREFAKFQYPAPVGSNAYIRATEQIYGDGHVLVRSIGGLGVNGNILTTVIADDFDVTTLVDTSNVIGEYIIAAQWQATSSGGFGTYTVHVTKNHHLGEYKMVTIAGTPTSGFTGVPTINASTGEITIPAVAFYRYTIQKTSNIVTLEEI